MESRLLCVINTPCRMSLPWGGEFVISEFVPLSFPSQAQGLHEWAEGKAPAMVRKVAGKRNGDSVHHGTSMSQTWPEASSSGPQGTRMVLSFLAYCKHWTTPLSVSFGLIIRRGKRLLPQAPQRTVWEGTPSTYFGLILLPSLIWSLLKSVLQCLLSSFPSLFHLSSLPSHNFHPAFSSQTPKQFQQGSGFRFQLELQFPSPKDCHQPQRFPRKELSPVWAAGVIVGSRPVCQRTSRHTPYHLFRHVRRRPRRGHGRRYWIQDFRRNPVRGVRLGLLLHHGLPG
jgi:hypothetical protein